MAPSAGPGLGGKWAAVEGRARRWADDGRRWRTWALEFLVFGLKEAWACLFAGLMLVLLVGTSLWWPEGAPIARYDVLVVAAVLIQIVLLAARAEKLDEALVILIFHVVGTAMELFKTAQGSWVYPEPSLLRIGEVPLFSGFMYACVGSYFARAWRLLDLRLEGYPPVWTTWVLAGGAYVNFFTHHYVADIRWGLFALSAVLFWRARFAFTPYRRTYRMPMLLGFVLVAFFIWVAENAGTFANAWIYPHQHDGWRPVGITKMGSWYLLMLLSFVLVTLVHRRDAGRT